MYFEEEKLLLVFYASNLSEARYQYRISLPNIRQIIECGHFFVCLCQDGEQNSVKLISKHLLERLNTQQLSTKEKVMRNMVKTNPVMKEIETEHLGNEFFNEVLVS